MNQEAVDVAAKSAAYKKLKVIKSEKQKRTE